MKSFITILIIVCFRMPTPGQAMYGGLYSTVEDYNKNKFAFGFPCDSVKTKVKVHEFFSTGITIRTKGSTIRFRAADFFGYQDCNGDAYRFYNKSAYLILNRNTIFLYAEDRIRSKSHESERVYFFSKNASDAILPLTIHELKIAYPDNRYFHDEIDAIFKDDHQPALITEPRNTALYDSIRNQSVTNKKEII